MSNMETIAAVVAAKVQGSRSFLQSFTLAFFAWLSEPDSAQGKLKGKALSQTFRTDLLKPLTAALSEVGVTDSDSMKEALKSAGEACSRCVAVAGSVKPEVMKVAADYRAGNYSLNLLAAARMANGTDKREPGERSKAKAEGEGEGAKAKAKADVPATPEDKLAAIVAIYLSLTEDERKVCQARLAKVDSEARKVRKSA